MSYAYLQFLRMKIAASSQRMRMLDSLFEVSTNDGLAPTAATAADTAPTISHRHGNSQPRHTKERCIHQCLSARRLYCHKPKECPRHIDRNQRIEPILQQQWKYRRRQNDIDRPHRHGRYMPSQFAARKAQHTDGLEAHNLGHPPPIPSQQSDKHHDVAQPQTDGVHPMVRPSGNLALPHQCHKEGCHLDRQQRGKVYGGIGQETYRRGRELRQCIALFYGGSLIVRYCCGIRHGVGRALVPASVSVGDDGRRLDGAQHHRRAGQTLLQIAALVGPPIIYS